MITPLPTATWQTIIRTMVGLALCVTSARAEPLPLPDLRDGWSVHVDEEGLDFADYAGQDAAGEIEHHATRPGPQQFGEYRQTEAYWVKGSFELTEAEAARSALLRSEQHAFGVEYWINGQEAGEWEIISPHTLPLPDGILKPGRNEMVLRIGGFAAIPRSGPKNAPLIPAGAARASWGRDHGIFSPFEIDFYDKAVVKHVLVVPRVERRELLLRIELHEDEPLSADARLVVRGDHLEPSEHAVTPTGDRFVDVVVPVSDDMPLWSPEKPELVGLTVALRDGGELLHERPVTYGFREVAIVGDDFTLNGQPRLIRGSNLVQEPKYNQERYDDPATIHEYMIRLGRGMNVNAFRTHTGPLPKSWMRVADEHGMMIFHETYLMYNHMNYEFSPENHELYRQRALQAAEQWVLHYGNHPSIVFWVASNEAPLTETDWENDVLVPHWKALDPSRPVMRAGFVSEDVADHHNYDGFKFGSEGDFALKVEGRLNDYRTLELTVPKANTEYIEGYKAYRRLRWHGTVENSDESRNVYAQLAHEQTDYLRRRDFEIIMPYMFGMWTGGRDTWATGERQPIYLALKQSLAPIYTSPDLIDRNHAAGSTLSVPLVVMNDTLDEATLRVNIYLTERDLDFGDDPDAFVELEPVARLDASLDAVSTAKRQVDLALPSAEGRFFVYVETIGDGGERAVSRRIIRTVEELKALPSLDDRRVVLLGEDSEVRQQLLDFGVTLINEVGDADVIVVATSLDEADRTSALAERLRLAAESGATVVVFADSSWNWPDLMPIEIKPNGRFTRNYVSSRAFTEQPDHPLFDGLNPIGFRRLNGVRGRIAEVAFDVPEDDESFRSLLWMHDPESSVIVEERVGDGRLLLSSVELGGRLDENGKRYDPFVERLLRNMIR